MITNNALTKTKWAIDPAHSEFEFKVKHMMITNVKGRFTEFEAFVTTSEDEYLTSDVEVRIKAASINTGDQKRDEHLKSSDFFDAENHEYITFQGTAHEKDSDSNFILYGDLTMRGISRQVKLDAEFNGLMKDPWGNEKAGFTVTGKINRKEWGLNWNAALEAGGVLVGEEVQINCDVQFVRQK